MVYWGVFGCGLFSPFLDSTLMHRCLVILEILQNICCHLRHVPHARSLRWRAPAEPFMVPALIACGQFSMGCSVLNIVGYMPSDLFESDLVRNILNL
jgi:hypothetical protein